MLVFYHAIDYVQDIFVTIRGVCVSGRISFMAFFMCSVLGK